MTAWLYQMNQVDWPLRDFRHDVHEKRTSKWQRRRKVGVSAVSTHDTIYFYYGHSVSEKPGFHGVAVADVYEAQNEIIKFTSVSPTNLLKKNPWWDDEAKELAKRIRRGTRGTIFEMTSHQEAAVKKGIARRLRAAL